MDNNDYLKKIYDLLVANEDPEIKRKLLYLGIFSDKHWNLLVEKEKLSMTILEALVGFLIISSFMAGGIISQEFKNIIQWLIILIISIIPIVIIDYRLKINLGIVSVARAAYGPSYDKNQSEINDKKSFLQKNIDSSFYYYLVILSILFAAINFMILTNFFIYSLSLLIEFFIIIVQTLLSIILYQNYKNQIQEIHQ